MASLAKEAEVLLEEGSSGSESAYLILKAATETDPDSLELLSLLVKACLLQGGEKIWEAISSARHAERVSESAPSARPQALSQLGLTFYIASTSNFIPLEARRKLGSEAIVMLEEALALSPQSFQTLFNLSRIKAETGDLREALKLARSAREVSDAKKGFGWALMVLICSAENKFDLALKCIQAFLGAAHTQEQMLLLRIQARIHQLQGDHELAIDSLAKAQARNLDGGSDSWLLIGDAFLAAGQVLDAEECLNKAKEKHNGPSALTQILTARISQVNGNWVAAVESCKNALAIDPHNAAALLLLAQLYLERNKLFDDVLAQGHLIDAVEFSPKSAEAWYLLGKVSQRTGHQQAAVASLKTALHLKSLEPALPFDVIPFVF